MRFGDVLKETVWLLLCEREVSYRRLRVEFDLDDDGLECLRHELIQVKRVAVDKDGSFLVWSNVDEATERVPALGGESLPPVRAGRPAASAKVSAESVAGPATVSEVRTTRAAASDAERRPLTVMFCDLADSTSLSTRLDPEDLQGVIRSYQDLCGRTIRAYDGFIAKYMGDGILVYFGYPKSLERSAERALRSALAIVEGMAELNRTVGRQKGIEIAVRIGIATGIVVVGEIVGEGLAQERMVTGEAPNLAARLQGIARRNGIVVGPLTKELAGNVFAYESLGAQELRGINGTVSAWGVTGLASAVAQEPGEPDTAGGVAVPYLVGRDEETALLRRAWQSTKEERRGRVVTISGEAGIGKSVLVDGLSAVVRAEGLPRTVFRCSLYHTNSPFHPVIEHLQRLAGWHPTDVPEVRLAKLETVLGRYSRPLAETVPPIAALLSLPLPEDRYPALGLTPQQQKQRTQDALIALTLDEAERRPLLQVWEDLNWADPSTLEFLGLLIEQAPTAALLMVLTMRPDFVPPWSGHTYITSITLDRLERTHTEAMIARIAAKPLPAEVVDHIVAKTDGVPLYVEELTKTILVSDVVRDVGTRFELTGPLSSLAIPGTLQESLMARLDRLPRVREIAQIGSVLGREFAYEMLSGLSAISESSLRQGLKQLVESELFYQRGRPPRETYIFKHALVRDAAYESLLKSQRQDLHARIAEAIEERFPESLKTRPEILAHHLSQAGLHERAVRHWRVAGELAVHRSANVEAIAHFSKALEALAAQPGGRERDATELALQMALAVPLMATKGLSDVAVERAYDRAQALCDELGEFDTLFAVLRGLWNCYLARGELQRTQALAVRIAALADDRKGPLETALAHRAIASTQFFLGNFAQALDEADQAIAIADSMEASDSGRANLFLYGERPGIVSRLYSGWALWFLGFADRAVGRFDEALALAESLGHAHSVAFALAFAAHMRNNRRDYAQALQYAESAYDIASRHQMPLWLAEGAIAKGFAQANVGLHSEGIENLRSGIASLKRIGDWHQRTQWLGLLAAAQLEAGLHADALATLKEGQEAAAVTEERYYAPELQRLMGAVLTKQSDLDKAEECFREALRTAKHLGAKTLELRAATSLARLWSEQSKHAEAREMLAPLYSSFTEGFGTFDLKEAKAVLDDLTCRQES
jgi:class 3 adenylate cyclase/predicted ATPase